MPGAHSVERYLVEESLNRIINTHYKDRKEWYVIHLLPLTRGEKKIGKHASSQEMSNSCRKFV